jgi:[ribosomal protein S18]-alanine N-acetyltransferase
MSELATPCLARPSDAREIAEMSRELIEHGLGWSWTPARVERSIRSRDSCVLVARRDARLAAFAIMHFSEETAHLNLLAVAPSHRRQGLGRQLLEWLFATAIEAGVFRIDLELRADNMSARSFYESMRFEAQNVITGYYQGREAALRMTRRLP